MDLSRLVAIIPDGPPRGQAAAERRLSQLQHEERQRPVQALAGAGIFGRHAPRSNLDALGQHLALERVAPQLKRANMELTTWSKMHTKECTEVMHTKECTEVMQLDVASAMAKMDEEGTRGSRA